MDKPSSPGFIDLHCHWVAHIDDGARSVEESKEMLRALRRAGFEHVVATPHMRPGMFDNRPEDLRRAFAAMVAVLEADPDDWPDVSLGSEHFFDALVIDRLVNGSALPYRANDHTGESIEREGGSVLVEFADLTPLSIIERQLFRLSTSGYIPVIAHPERYPAVWKDPGLVERLQLSGCVALLDICALVGKYGARPQETARRLLADGTYHAACSDSHRPVDVELTVEAMELVRQEYGSDEVDLLFRSGPADLLAGRRPSSL